MFKLTKYVPIYGGVILMAAAWEAVKKYMVLNGWIKTDIMTSYQMGEDWDILKNYEGVVEKDKRPMRGKLDTTVARGKDHTEVLESEPSAEPEE